VSGAGSGAPLLSAIGHWARRDAAVIEALTALGTTKPRWGFWKYVDRLRNTGQRWNHKRLWRVYCQLRLNLPRRTKKRVPARVVQPLDVTPQPNVGWAVDFMSDTLMAGGGSGPSTFWMKGAKSWRSKSIPRCRPNG
jgi:hypothetical protein